MLEDYGRARESNERLSDRLQEVKLENKALCIYRTESPVCTEY